jgi:hypothetical protein
VRRRLTGHRGDVLALAFTADGKHVVTAGMDATGLVWDLRLSGAAAERAGPPTAAEREQLWKSLADAPAEPAYRALARLATHPDETVGWLRKRLRPATGPDGATLDRLLAELGATRFAVRERAAAELDRLGDLAVPGVLARLDAAKELERRRRLDRFLEKHDRAVPSADRLRELRSVELLEHLGTPAARALLRDLAGGAAAVRLTQDAAAALGRLQRAKP